VFSKYINAIICKALLFIITIIKSMLKKFFLFVLILISSFTPSHATVVPEGSTSPDNMPTAVMPSLSVDKVVLGKTSFSDGDFIEGSFIVTNHSDFSLSNTSYRILVGSNYAEFGNLKVSNSILDASSIQILGNLAINESKKVNFKYQIPSGINGSKLAVDINVYSDNSIILTKGSSDYITINGTPASVVFSNAQVKLSTGKLFGLSDGPIIYKDKDPKNASVIVSVNNSTKEEIILTPEISVYNQSNQSLKITSKAKDLKIDAGKKTTQTIDLPNMSYDPGVYFAEITLFDKSHKQIGSKIGARYIIDGDIANIHTLKTDKTVLSKGELFRLNYTISGKPFDISALIEPDSKNDKVEKPTEQKKEGKLVIQIFNELGEIVAVQDEPFSLQGDTIGDVELSAINSAKSIRANVMITNKDGILFLNKDIELSGDYDKISFEEISKIKLIKYISLFLLAVFIVVGIIFIRKRKVNAGVLGLFIILVVLPIPLITNGWVLTARTPPHALNMYGQLVDGAPNVSVGAPYDNQTFYEGQSYHFWGYLYYIACSNSVQNVRIQATESVTGQYLDFLVLHRNQLGGEAVWYENTQFQSPAINVGTKAGAHLLRFRALNANGGLFDSTWGYVPYNVICNPGRIVDSSGNCSNPPPVVTTDGLCGTADGRGSLTSPTTNLCSRGTASAVTTQNGKWSWSCTGTNTNGAGNIKSCLATKDPSVCIGTCGGILPDDVCESGIYCDGVCQASGQTCTPAFVPNPNIELENEGPVSLKTLNPSPSLGNKGYSCVIDWGSDVFKSYDNYTRCTITSGGQSLSFIPASTTSPTSFTVSNIQVDSSAKMTCTQVDGTATASKEAICRVNWSAQEVN
jgi:hypothetical protein